MKHTKHTGEITIPTAYIRQMDSSVFSQQKSRTNRGRWKIMEELRNITKEAIELTKEHVIKENPSMADKAYREGLDPFVKAVIVSKLMQLVEYFENVLIRS